MIRRLLIFHLIAGCLFLSWLVPPTSDLWQQLDEWFFQTMNGTLLGRPQWQSLLAVLCSSQLDLPLGLYLGTLAFLYLVGGAHTELIQRCTTFGLTALFFFLAIGEVHRLLDLLEWNRLSPSLTLTPQVWLSKTLETSLNIRDNSTTSFPGDHALQLYFWTAFFWRYGGRKLGIPAALLAVTFSMPRLISGSHWLSDELVGSLCFTLVLWSWATLGQPRAIEIHPRQEAQRSPL